jgi:GNAT superfamily N-acetyltransferase
MLAATRRFEHLDGSAGHDVEPEDYRALASAHLSNWFDPFLGAFALEALRSGGDAWVYRSGPDPVALVLTDPFDKVASVLTQSRSFASSALRARGDLAMYAEHAFHPRGEAYDVFAWGAAGVPIDDRFAHRVRPVEAADLPAVLGLLREVYGSANERWFVGTDRGRESGFVVDVDGSPAGVGWLALTGAHARLHSLTVRAPYRRLGIGRDLVVARLLAARQAGARRVLSEISVRNVASLGIAVRVGMRRVGELFLYPPNPS